jgi:ubiquinone/menaquinone biosynthesis C-methylase UbiE
VVSTPEPASISFDRAAGFYDATRDVGNVVSEWTLEVLRTHLPAREKVLEIGVGTGLIALPLVADGIRVTGVDLSSQMMAKLIEKAGGVAPLPLVRCDSVRLPFRDDVFSAAYARHVLHLISDWRIAVAELCRVVGDGPILVDVGGGEDAWLDLWREMRSVLGPEADHVGLDVARDDAGVLDEAFIQAGATVGPIVSLAHPDNQTVASLLAEVERRTPSWTWRVSNHDVARAADVARRWTMSRYGTLDVSLADEITTRWHTYQVG